MTKGKRRHKSTRHKVTDTSSAGEQNLISTSELTEEDMKALPPKMESKFTDRRKEIYLPNPMQNVKKAKKNDERRLNQKMHNALLKLQYKVTVF